MFLRRSCYTDFDNLCPTSKVVSGTGSFQVKRKENAEGTRFQLHWSIVAPLLFDSGTSGRLPSLSRFGPVWVH
jgi:hypothetical protein